MSHLAIQRIGQLPGDEMEPHACRRNAPTTMVIPTTTGVGVLVDVPRGAAGLVVRRVALTRQRRNARRRARWVMGDSTAGMATGFVHAESLLTADEKRLVSDLCEWFDLFRQLAPRTGVMLADTREAIAHVHALQNMVLAQAAARAMPERYRLIGYMP